MCHLLRVSSFGILSLSMYLFSSIIEVSGLRFPSIENCASIMCFDFSFRKVPGCFKNEVYRLCIRTTGDQPMTSERESG